MTEHDAFPEQGPFCLKLRRHVEAQTWLELAMPRLADWSCQEQQSGLPRTKLMLNYYGRHEA